MEISMVSLLYSFLWSIALGAFLGTVYDTVRIGRIFLGVSYSRVARVQLSGIKLPLISGTKKEKKRKGRGIPSLALNILIFAGDLLFCVFAAIVLVIFIYHSNDGRARWMVFFGTAAGFAAYYFTLGRIVMFFSSYIVFVIRSVFSYACFIVWLPVKAIISLILRLSRQVIARVYTKNEMKRMKKDSRIGFIG